MALSKATKEKQEELELEVEKEEKEKQIEVVEVKEEWGRRRRKEGEGEEEEEELPLHPYQTLLVKRKEREKKKRNGHRGLGKMRMGVGVGGRLGPVGVGGFSSHLAELSYGEANLPSALRYSSLHGFRSRVDTLPYLSASLNKKYDHIPKLILYLDHMSRHPVFPGCFDVLRNLRIKISKERNTLTHKICQEGFVLFGGQTPVISLLTSLSFFDDNGREIPRESKKGGGEGKEEGLSKWYCRVYNTCMVILREACYAHPSLSAMLCEDNELIKYLFSLMYDKNTFESALTLTEELLASRPTTFPLSLLPSLPSLTLSFSRSQLTFFCRVLALLVFNSEESGLGGAARRRGKGPVGLLPLFGVVEGEEGEGVGEGEGEGDVVEREWERLLEGFKVRLKSTLLEKRRSRRRSQAFPNHRTKPQNSLQHPQTPRKISPHLRPPNSPCIFSLEFGHVRIWEVGGRGVEKGRRRRRRGGGAGGRGRGGGGG